ncbi:ketopantoate reductase family protein [Oceaniglobus trochenteri]|uniref:ketopantoate reductase family protein n=1 Tax=Oceaniglobus trochenteri TaxID=2763260 RepID=UPI001D001467
MRFIVYGVGGIGGGLAVALADSGQDVIGIARGAQLDAIRKGGLRLLTPDGERHAHFPCVGGPEEIDLREGDMILLTMKSQDTAAALARLAECGLRDQPVFCFQNGVANERLAASMGMNTHGVTVMMPGTYLTPGTVAVHATPRLAILDIGRYPQGNDRDDHALAGALEAAGMACFVLDRVMDSKHGKLLLNLGNIIQAALGAGEPADDLTGPVRAEARAVLAAAGIAWDDKDASDPRRETLLRSGEIEGVPRPGGSTLQSLLRGTGSVETDYLNGEIVELGKAHGVETPLNAALVALGRRMAREGLAPGSIGRDALEGLLGR